MADTARESDAFGNLARLSERLTGMIPPTLAWTLRLSRERHESIRFRKNVLQPPYNAWSEGAFLTVFGEGGMGYAATADLSDDGLTRAANEAVGWVDASRGLCVFDPDVLSLTSQQDSYERPPLHPWNELAPDARIALAHDACAAMAIDDRIVDWSAYLSWEMAEMALLNSVGGCITQRFHYLIPGLSATANVGAESQRRTGARMAGRQGGLEQLGPQGFPDDARRIAEEAIELLSAPQCPEGLMDLVLTPSQMALQIHESIGHPLELDRILGDERNYAGASFVTLDMFGSYRYGSDLLNITFDPGIPAQLANYGYDDEGTPAKKVHLIRDGILERPLGGASSQARAGVPGTANARACSWNRPPIDRMANINLEPGGSSLKELIGRVEKGVLMDTNRSWSIDDSRNKFQFGCEYARLIEKGELRGVVRNPNYRGISASFWRSLAGVGDRDSFEVLGVANCGKGEPNQAIYVGHASPACLFRDVDVFSGGN